MCVCCAHTPSSSCPAEVRVNLHGTGLKRAVLHLYKVSPRVCFIVALRSGSVMFLCWWLTCRKVTNPTLNHSVRSSCCVPQVHQEGPRFSFSILQMHSLSCWSRPWSSALRAPIMLFSLRVTAFSFANRGFSLSSTENSHSHIYTHTQTALSFK